MHRDSQTDRGRDKTEADRYKADRQTQTDMISKQADVNQVNIAHHGEYMTVQG